VVIRPRTPDASIPKRRTLPGAGTGRRDATCRVGNRCQRASSFHSPLCGLYPHADIAIGVPEKNPRKCGFWAFPVVAFCPVCANVLETRALNVRVDSQKNVRKGTLAYKAASIVPCWCYRGVRGASVCKFADRGVRGVVRAVLSTLAQPR